jgi:hypothetical protein
VTVLAELLPDLMPLDYNLMLGDLASNKLALEEAVKRGELTPEEATREYSAAYWRNAYAMSRNTGLHVERTPLNGPVGFLQRSVQGSRVHGARMETSYNGVRSMDGGGFSGMGGETAHIGLRMKGQSP